MKKITIAIILCLIIIGGVFAQDKYSIDLSTLPAAKNTTPFAYQYDDFMIRLPALPVNVTQYRNVVIKAKCYDANGNVIPSNWGNAMVTLLIDISMYDRNRDAREIRQDGHRNHIVKEFNVGEDGPGDISKDSGVRTVIRGNPTGILFQSASADVKFIEVTEITFHTKR